MVCLSSFFRTWAAHRTGSAVPPAATCSSTRDWVCPLLRCQFPSILRLTFLRWIPPKQITTCCSPYCSSHFYWTCFAIAKSGWSKAMTGVCCALKCLTTQRTTSIECLLVCRNFHGRVGKDLLVWWGSPLKAGSQHASSPWDVFMNLVCVAPSLRIHVIFSSQPCSFLLRCFNQSISPGASWTEVDSTRS